MSDLKLLIWGLVIMFGLLIVGTIFSAHHDTPNTGGCIRPDYGQVYESNC